MGRSTEQDRGKLAVADTYNRHHQRPGTETHLYRDFIKTLSDRINQCLGTITTQHNFEYGAEFEVTLCDALRSILPDRFGIHRGYIVNESGDTAGDDIIISARDRFPTLALRVRDSFSRKEFVPAESAYCYIEAKNTIEIIGDGPQSLTRACQQVERVKQICGRRPEIHPAQLAPYLKVAGPHINVDTPTGFPPILNPMFGAIFAHQVRERPNGELITNPEQIRTLVLQRKRIGEILSPDLVVLGPNLVMIPALNGNQYCSPFFIPGASLLQVRPCPEVAFGIGISSLMYALDWIQLGVMPWRRVIGEPLA